MTREQLNDGQAPVRVLHYMGTNFGMSGIETFILHLCGAQKRAGLIPSIAMEMAGREEVQTSCAKLGVEVHELPEMTPAEKSLPSKLGKALLRWRRMTMLARELRRYDVLHMHPIGISCLEGLIAARLAGTKALIVTHHGTLSWFAQYRNLTCEFTLWLERRWASNAVMPYKAAAVELVEAGMPEDRTSVVPFCVDEELFSGLAPVPMDEELTLVMAARMVPGKGQAHLLAAVAKLAPRYPKLKAVLLGDGPLRPEIEADITRLGLRNVVTSMGRVHPRDIPSIMRTAHVIVLPTYMEGETFPLCLIEGMALGLPAIATRWFGIPDIVEDGKTGILVEPQDEDGLARAIQHLLEEPAFYAELRQGALTRFHSQFSAAAVSRTYSQHYLAALQN